MTDIPLSGQRAIGKMFDRGVSFYSLFTEACVSGQHYIFEIRSVFIIEKLYRNYLSVK